MPTTAKFATLALLQLLLLPIVASADEAGVPTPAAAGMTSTSGTSSMNVTVGTYDTGTSAICLRTCYCRKPQPCLGCMPTGGMCVPYCRKPLPCDTGIPCDGMRVCYDRKQLCVPRRLISPPCCDVPPTQ